MIVKIGKVKLPLFAILRAIGPAAKAAAAEYAAAKDATSEGGAKVTIEEVGEVVLTFVTALAEEVLPAVAKVNGL